VRQLLADAASIFETASCAPDDGQSPDLAILVERSGALRIVEGAGWRSDALQQHYGAQAVYQVTHGSCGVRVEACDGRDRCVLESSAPAPRLPFARPAYTVLTAARLIA
jgi:hypothetical protein